MLSGVVYDASVGPGRRIGGAVVSVLTCLGHLLQEEAGTNGAYSLLLPGTDLGPCSEVTLFTFASGFQSLEKGISVAELRAQPSLDIGLFPVGFATPTATRTRLPGGHRVFLPLTLRRYWRGSGILTPTWTPTPTRTPSGVQQQLIVNSSFENNQAWVIPQTARPAGYSVSRAHQGLRSMRLGLVSGDNVFSYSSTRQTVDIPAGVTHAALSFHYFPLMRWDSGDLLYFCVLRAVDDRVLYCDDWVDPNQAWNSRGYDLLAYAGQRIKVHFGVKNDGWGGVSAAYLDDVELWVAGAQ
jgi:hypothetical protein